jgi:hypothetical protein
VTAPETAQTERWIAYPVLLWLVGFGAHLMSVDLGRSR